MRKNVTEYDDDWFKGQIFGRLSPQVIRISMTVWTPVTFRCFAFGSFA